MSVGSTPACSFQGPALSRAISSDGTRRVARFHRARAVGEGDADFVSLAAALVGEDGDQRWRDEPSLPPSVVVRGRGALHEAPPEREASGAVRRCDG